MEGGYFRVDGADLESGEESYLILQAASVAEAAAVARKQGLLIAAVRSASATDWGAAPRAKKIVPNTRQAEPVITFEPRTPPAGFAHEAAEGMPSPDDDGSSIKPFEVVDSHCLIDKPDPRKIEKSSRPLSTEIDLAISTQAKIIAPVAPPVRIPEKLPSVSGAQDSPAAADVQKSAAVREEAPVAVISPAKSLAPEAISTPADLVTLSKSPPEVEAALADRDARHQRQSGDATVDSVEQEDFTELTLSDADEGSGQGAASLSSAIDSEMHLADTMDLPAVVGLEGEAASTPTMRLPAVKATAPKGIADEAIPAGAPTGTASNGSKTRREKESVFADTPLPPKVETWTTSKATDDRAALAESLGDSHGVNGNSSPLVQMREKSGAQTRADQPVAGEAFATVSNSHSSKAIESPAPAMAVEASQSSDIDRSDIAVETPVPVLDETRAEIQSHATITIEAVEPKAVAVKATPVLVPKASLAANLRRIAPASVLGGKRPTARNDLPGHSSPVLVQPISRTLPIVQNGGSGDGTQTPPENPEAKAPAPTRTFAATVPPRRFGRQGPVSPPRRPPQSVSTGPASARDARKTIPESKSNPTENETSKLVADGNDKPEIVVETAANERKTTGLDDLLSTLIPDQSVKAGDRAENARSTSIGPVGPDTALPAPQSFPTTAVLEPEKPSEIQAPASTSAVQAAIDESALAAETSQETASASRIAGIGALQPVAEPGAVRLGFSPLIVLFLAPLATLLMLGGVGLVIFAQLAPLPTAAVELEKVDFHLQTMMQTMIGCTAILAGLLIFLMAALKQFSRAIQGRRSH